MNSPDKNLGRGFFLTLLILLGLMFAGCRKSSSICYVDNGRLLRDVKLFMALRDSVQSFNKTWQKNAEPLKDSVDSYMKKIGAMSGGISNAERAAVEKEFQSRQDAFQQFVRANQKKAEDLDKSLSEEALKKVNAVLQKYRDERGYSIILGTTAGGNILAADKSLDITEDVIKYLNAGL